MKRSIILLFFINIFLLNTLGIFALELPEEQKSMKKERIFSGVEKINDDLYVGKAADGFYFAMERINQNNLDMWLQYAKNQVAAGNRMNLKFLPSTDGSSHFELVLDKYKSGTIRPHNEIWVAYASAIPINKKADLDVYSKNPTNPFIEMFVTVATTPEALITSHMGISRTWEAALDLQQKSPKRKKYPYQSVQLHSFAAKVMKLRGPEKVYMMTAPAIAMRNILLKKMPIESIFVGDNLYQAKLEAAEKDPFTLLTEFDLEEEEGETVYGRGKRLKKEVEQSYNFYKIKEKISLLKSNPPRIIRAGKGESQKFTILDSEGKQLAIFDLSTPSYQWIFTEPYADRGLHLPYVLVDLDELAQVGVLEAEYSK